MAVQRRIVDMSCRNNVISPKRQSCVGWARVRSREGHRHRENDWRQGQRFNRCMAPPHTRLAGQPVRESWSYKLKACLGVYGKQKRAVKPNRPGHKKKQRDIAHRKGTRGEASLPQRGNAPNRSCSKHRLGGALSLYTHVGMRVFKANGPAGRLPAGMRVP